MWSPGDLDDAGVRRRTMEPYLVLGLERWLQRGVGPEQREWHRCRYAGVRIPAADGITGDRRVEHRWVAREERVDAAFDRGRCGLVGGIAPGDRRLGEEHLPHRVAASAVVVHVPHRVSRLLEHLRVDRRREQLVVAVVQRWVLEQRTRDEVRSGAGEVRRNGTAE